MTILFRFGWLSLLLLVAFGGCAAVAPQRAPDPAVRPIPIRNQSTLAIARAEGRYGNEIEPYVRQAIDERARFLVIDAERAYRLADQVRRGRARDRDPETYGVDIVIYSRVTEHDITERENLAGAAELVAIVEVYFEVIDLRTGEMRGARRVRRERSENRLVAGGLGRFLGQDNRRSRDERTGAGRALIEVAREAVARDFARALTRG